MLVHFDEPFLTIHWDDDAGVIWAEWKDSVGGEPMQRGLFAGLDLILQKKAHKWLADTRRLGAMDPADVKWVNDVWLPRAVAGGVCWMAFLAPEKVVVQLAVKSFMSRINERELGIAYFDNIDAARAWLRDQP
jgi:hypothetical protein